MSEIEDHSVNERRAKIYDYLKAIGGDKKKKEIVESHSGFIATPDRERRYVHD